jgi:effector-binding domain-containing protein
MDISGKTIFISQLTSNRQTIDISALPAGTYLYRIFNPKGLEETGKLVVE